MSKDSNKFPRKTFVVYTSWYDGIRPMTMAQRGELFSALMEYHLTGTPPEENNPIYQVFSFIKGGLDANIDKYDEKVVDRNRKNGQKGGRPPKKPNGLEENQTVKNKPNKTQWVKNNPNNPVNVNGNGNVNENECENGEKPHTHDFLISVEYELLTDKNIKKIVGKQNYINKVFYFIDAKREKILQKNDLADAKDHFKNFIQQDNHKARGETYFREITDKENHLETTKKVYEFFLNDPECKQIAEQKELSKEAIHKFTGSYRNLLVEYYKKGFTDLLRNFLNDNANQKLNSTECTQPR